jgi:hypothetical protein|tara:strand:+ start:11777 stop:12154 length:378 start_codon:yes stop_codon:yes gene_type:complete
MTPRTDKELKELAVDIFENKVFGTWAFRDDQEMESLMGMVFMPFLFMSQEDKAKLTAAKVHHIYEYYDQAGPRSINGKPIFMSMRFILDTEWVKIKKYVEKLEAYRKDFVGDTNPEVNWHAPMGG